MTVSFETPTWHLLENPASPALARAEEPAAAPPCCWGSQRLGVHCAWLGCLLVLALPQLLLTWTHVQHISLWEPVLATRH